MGLLSAMAAGAATGYRDAVNKDTENQVDMEKKQQLMQMELEMKDLYAKRMAEQANKYEDQVNTKATGLLAQKDQKQLDDYNTDPENDSENVSTMDQFKNSPYYKPPTASEELQAKIDSSTGTARKEYQAELTAHNKDMNEQRREDTRLIHEQNIETKNENRRQAQEERNGNMLVGILAGGRGKDGTGSDGGVEGWKYSQWKLANPSGNYSDFVTWQSDFKHKGIPDITLDLIKSDGFQPSSAELKGTNRFALARQAAQKLYDMAHPSKATDGVVPPTPQKASRPPLKTVFGN